MSRPRLFEPGFSHHIIHRGNNRCDVFRDDHDRRRFMATLANAAARSGVAIHGYVLMTTHFHLLATGDDETSVPRTMQDLASYVRYFNRRHGRTGTLWEGRYHAGLIADERYWLTCLRYIELNPVRAGMVMAPADYEWSSYRANAGIVTNKLLTPHPVHVQLGTDLATRAANWSAICGNPLSEEELTLIRHQTQQGSTVGEREDDQGPRLVA